MERKNPVLLMEIYLKVPVATEVMTSKIKTFILYL